MTALVEQHPRRLVGLGTVPLQHPELAVAELTQAVDEFGLRGVQVGTLAGDRELADDALEGFWARAEELDAVVFVHPWGCSLGERLDRYYLSNVVGNPVETTVALSHLVFSGLLTGIPGVRIVAAHGGGYLPTYLGRSDHAWRVRPESQRPAEPPSTYLRRMWFDSLVYTRSHCVTWSKPSGPIASSSAATTRSTWALPTRLTGWPPRASTPEQEQAIRGENAANLLRLPSLRSSTIRSFPMPNRLITHVRHVDLAVPDFEKEREFFRNTWGLSEVVDDNGISFLAAEGSPEQYIVRLRQDAEKRLELLAFGATDEAAVDTLAQRLAEGGVQLVNEPGTMQTPGGGYGFRFFDIDGRTVEISSDVDPRQHRKIEPKEAIPVPAVPRRHQLASARTDRGAFIQKWLDFSLSDTLMSPHMGEVMWFLRCSTWHHNIAIARCPHVSLHHASFEMRGIDEYMRGTGRLLRAGVEKIWGPGRHLAGSNTFSYFLDPQGNTVEYTTELEFIDEDTWHPHLYDFSNPEVTDQWGTSEPDERDGRQEVLQRPGRRLRRPTRLMVAV